MIMIDAMTSPIVSVGQLSLPAVDHGLGHPVTLLVEDQHRRR
jgi:hypothetical protein